MAPPRRSVGHAHALVSERSRSRKGIKHAAATQTTASKSVEAKKRARAIRSFFHHATFEVHRRDHVMMVGGGGGQLGNLAPLATVYGAHTQSPAGLLLPARPC